MISKANWTDFSSMDGSTALATVNRVFPPWISALLVVAIAWQLADIVWMLVPGTATGDVVDAPAGVQVAAVTGGPTADVQAIAEKHLFGHADTEAAPVLPVPEIDDNLSDTRLTNLVLKGTIASDRPEFSVAVIADGTAEQRVYAIGDPVGSGTTLHAVYPERVVLNENGALTNLRLPVDFPTVAERPVRRTATTRQTASNSDPNSLQNVLTQNLTKLSDVIRPTPYLVNGEQAGYRVYPGRNRQQFAALGLRPGDLIKDIDGQSLTDPTQAIQIFQSLGSTDQVTVTVERNGQPETIVLKTSQLELDGEPTQ